jgi:hypothetical protein
MVVLSLLVIGTLFFARRLPSRSLIPDEEPAAGST